MANRICFASVDAERGVEDLPKILSIFKKYGIKATLFVTGEILKEKSDLFRRLSKTYEISCHTFSHRFWNEIKTRERQKELTDFIKLYRRIFRGQPKGFRASSHIIDEDGLRLVEKNGFLYDSSIVPHYPPIKKYRGYKGRFPLNPYYPNGLKILEIPVRGQILGIPLAGSWIRKLPTLFYRILFLFYAPGFITLNMHSWDAIDPEFIGKLEKVARLLKSKNYQFLNGAEIFQKNRK